MSPIITDHEIKTNKKRSPTNRGNQCGRVSSIRHTIELKIAQQRERQKITESIKFFYNVTKLNCSNINKIIIIRCEFCFLSVSIYNEWAIEINQASLYSISCKLKRTEWKRIHKAYVVPVFFSFDISTTNTLHAFNNNIRRL